MDTEVKVSLDLFNYLGYNELRESKDFVTPIKTKMKKHNLYQLVYNEFEDCEDRPRGSEMYPDDVKKIEPEGDGDSLDLHLTPGQRVAEILGRSEGDTWSLGKDDTDLGISLDFGLKCLSDVSMEDTFQSELKRAKMLYEQSDILSTISNDKTQNCFENNADFSMYHRPPLLHSTPIKHHGYEMNGIIPNWNTEDTEDITALKENNEGQGSNADNDGSFVRFFKNSFSNEQNGKPRNLTQLSCSVSPTHPSLHRQTLAGRLRGTLTRPLSPTGRISDLTVKYNGPPKFELDFADCYIDDDDVTHFSRIDDGSDQEFAKIFREMLQPSPNCIDKSDNGRS